MKKYLLSLLIAIPLFGCQMHPLKAFERLTPGMEKDDVLDIMGSPVTTLRRQGKDRWLYVFYQDQIRFEKEVQFFEGKAIYVGELWQPPADQQAAYVDAQNAIGTAEGKRQAQKDYQKYLEQSKAKSNSTLTVPTGTANESTPADAPEVKPDVKYVPKFEAVQ